MKLIQSRNRNDRLSRKMLSTNYKADNEYGHVMNKSS